jgi:hypothetical protein
MLKPRRFQKISAVLRDSANVQQQIRSMKWPGLLKNGHVVAEAESRLVLIT